MAIISLNRKSPLPLSEGWSFTSILKVLLLLMLMQIELSVIPTCVFTVLSCGPDAFSASLQHWPVFKEVTEVFILVPALLGLKGNLEMTLASRLSTAVRHVTIKDKFKASTRKENGVYSDRSKLIYTTLTILTLADLHIMKMDPNPNPGSKFTTSKERWCLNILCGMCCCRIVSLICGGVKY